MRSKISTAENRKPPTLPLLAIAFAFAVPLALAFFVPYAAGYLGPRLSIAATLENMWSGEQWQHCWLVLPAIATIIYIDRTALAEIPLAGSWWGGPALGAACFFWWAGYRVDNYYVGFAALHMLVAAIILFVGGWRLFWAIIFPLMFMVFLWPLFFLEQSITFPLRMVMAKTAVFVLNILGEHVIRQGTGILSAPDPLLGMVAGKKFSIDVADPCSGIRSLFALMMVSALYAHFTLRTWWEKWILFLCSIPLAIAGNLVRILALTMATVAFGSEFAIGKNPLTEPSWFHMGAGYAVFAVALGGMISIAWLLTNLENLTSRCMSLIQTLKNETMNPASVSSSPSQHPSGVDHLSSDTTPDTKTNPAAKTPHRPESPY